MNATACEWTTRRNFEAGSARAKRLRPAARSGPEGAKRGWARRRNRAWDSLRSVTGFARGDTARAAKSPPLAAALGTLLFLALGAPSSADAAVLVSNVGKDSSGTRDVGANDYAQAFDTGDNPGGYYLESIVLDFNAAPTGSATLTVTVRADSSSGPSATVLYTLTNPTLAAGLNEFEAPSNARLSANTTYHVVASYNADSGGPSWNRVLLNSGLDAGAASGWEIDAPYLIKDRDDAAGEWQEQSNQRAIKIQVKGNNAATGEPTIAGFAQVGNTLTAGTGMIADRDGLPATFDFQWVRVDGGTETDITGATSSTYTPVTADLSQTLKVKVSFTDRQSNEEMVTSAATAAVVEAPAACDADAHWCALLTVGIGGLAVSDNRPGGYCDPASGRPATLCPYGALDDDDFTLDSVAYTVESLRWATGTGASDALHLTLNRDFPGASLPRLTLEVDGHDFDLSDASRGNNDLNVDNNYVWRGAPAALKGYAAGRAVRVELFANTPATGAPVVMGRAQVGATLTASTARIMDADGLGTFSYQWSREDEDASNAADISGATSATYELVAADNDKRIRVKVSFTDGEGYAEELTSAAFPSQGTVAMAPPEMVDPTALWSATLNAKDLVGGLVGCDNVGSNQCTQTSVLSDNDFTVDSTTYTIEQIYVLSGSLAARFDTALPSAASGWELRVTEGGTTTTLNFSDDTDSRDAFVSWGSTGLSWSEGDAISLAIWEGATDETPPTLSSASIGTSGDDIVLAFSENLDTTNRPAASDFTVKADGSAVTAIYAEATGTNYTLALSPPVGKGRTVTVSYFDPTSANDPNALQDAAGNDVATFENIAVTNNSEANNPATGAPGISGTAQVGHELTASTGDIMDLDGLMGATYAYQWIRVDADGTSNPTDIGGATSSTYTLATADQGKTIKVKVTFQDEEGNDEALTSDAYPPGTDTVTADTTRPTLSTATVNDDSLVLTYSENLDTTSTPASTAFTVRVAGSTRSLAGMNPVTVSGDTVTLTLASDVMEGETVTVSYTVPGTNPLQDPQGNDAAALVNQAVTNLTIDLPDITIEADRPTATGANDVIRYTLERDGPTTSALTVTVTLAAPAGNDWGLDSDDLNPEVTFGAGVDSKVLVVSLISTGPSNIGFDAGAAFDGPLTATLGAVTGYDTRDTAVVDVVAVPPPRWFGRLVGHPYRFTEDGGSQNVEVEVYAADPAMPAPSFDINPTTATMQVSVSTGSPGTATVYSGVTMVGDYTALSQEVPFPPSVFSVGEGRVQRGRVRVPVEIRQDDLIEGDETTSILLNRGLLVPFGAMHFDVPGGTRAMTATYPHVVTIVDDDFGVTGVEITSTPGASADTYGVGDEIRFTVTFNKPATVTGTPTLTFRMGASGSEADRTASYQSGSGTNALVFSYTVAAADSDSDGVSVLAGTTTNNTFSFPTGAHIRYGSTDAVLLHDALAADSGHKVDGTMSPAGAPTAPTGLSATAVGANRIDLEWNTPSSMGASDIEGYKIEWSADGNAPWTEETANTGNTDTTYSDTGLASATTRHYRVSAINDTLTGPVSNVAHATTEAGVPGTPTGLSATARDADPADGETEIELSWTEPGEMGDSDISGYRIEYSADGNEPWMELEATTGSTATTYIDDELPSETTRHYRVSAVNDQGAGGPSNTDSATTDDIEGPVLLSAGTDHGQLTLRFDEELDTASANAPPKSAFTVTADGVPLDFGTVEALTAPDAYLVTLAGLSPQVRRGQTAVVTYTDPSANDDTAAIQDDDGNDAASFTTGQGDVPAVTNSSTVDPTAPGMVPSLTAEAGSDGTSIVLAWERPADNGGRVISSYRIEVCETSCDQDSSWTAAVETHDEMENGAIVLSYEHTVPAGATREYRVAARNSVDLGAWSDPPTIGQAVHPGAPGKPTGLTAEGRLPTTPNGTTLVKLSWDAPSDIGESEITGYRVEFSETIDPPSWEHVFTTRSTSTIHSPLPSEATRHYRVFAINDQGRSLPSDVVTETTPDIAAPVPESASVPTAGTSVVITFDEALDETTANLPQAERFTLTSADGAVFIPASVAVSDKTATVWLDSTSALIRTGQTLTLAYTDRTTNDDATGVVQDDDGNDAAAFTVGAGETVTITNGSTQPVTEPGEPRNVRAESGGEDRIVITWDAPIETGGRDITGYEVFVGPDDGNVTTSLVSGHTTKNSAGRFEYVHDGLSVGDQRWYTVHATNSGGHVGAGSPPVLGTVDKKGDVELSVDAASVAEGGTVTWTVTATTDEGEAPGSGLPMQVTVTSADGVSIAPGDYAAVDETVTFTAADFTQMTVDGAIAYVATKTGTIATVDDLAVESGEGFTLAMEVTSGGTGWVTGTDEVTVSIEDDDRWGVTVEADPDTIVEGETREVRLTARIMHVDGNGVASVPPAGTCVARFHVDVGLEVGGTATGAGTDYTLEGSTPEREIEACAAAAEWRVTLTALVDTVDDDAETVTFTPVLGGGEPFAPVSLEAGVVTIGEEPGVVLGVAALGVEEGESASYTVVLTARPSGTVTLTPSVSGDMDVTVSPAQLRFDGDNWSLPQSVTVRADHDEDDEDDTATVSHRVSGADYGSVTVGQVRVNVRDDDKSFGELRVELTGGRDRGRSSPVPRIHHGEKFRIGLHWSETRTWPWAEPHRAVGADRAIRVTGGTVRPVPTPYYNAYTQHVLILEFTPDSAGSDVTLVLEPLDCSSPDPQRPNPSALCARLDNGNGAITGLAERVRYTVYGIDSVPAAPTNLLIEAEDQLASDGVTVTVTGTALFAVFDPPAPGAERWRVEAQAPGGDWSGPRVWRGDRRGTRYPYRARMDGLAADGAWEIRARWENRYGAGPWAEAETTDAPALGAPRNVQVAQGAQGRSASLTWSPPAGSSGQVARYQYRLGWDAASWAEGWRAIPDSGPGAANEASYTVHGVEQSWSVEASIRAVDRSGRAGTPSAVARVPAAAPTVLEGGVRVTSDPGEDGRYAAGDEIGVAVRMSRPVVLEGAGTGFNFNRQRGEWIHEAGISSESGPTVTLEIGARRPAARLVRIGGVAGADVPGSVSGDTLHFRYTVQGIDEDMDGIRIPSGGLSLNASELVDANDADTAARFSLGEAIAFPGHLVQGIPAQVEKIERVGHQVWVYFTQDLTPVTLVPHLRNGAIGDQFRVEFPSSGSSGGDVTDARIVRGRGWGSNCRRGETGCKAVRLTTRSRARADETMTIAYVPNPHHPKYRLRDLAGNEAKAFGRTTAVPLGAGDSPVMSVSDAEGYEQIAHLRTLHFNVKLIPAATREVTVRYTTQDGRVDGDQLAARGYLSATENVDYEKESGTLVFKPGDTGHPVRVEIIDDGIEDGGEVFALVLSDLTGPATFGDSVGQGLIHNHEVLTATFEEVPEDHDGASAFSLELAFNEPVTADADTVKGALTVTGGEATTVTAVGTDAKRFELTVTPAGTDAVTVAIGPELDCTATNAVCTAEDIGLERRFETTIDHDGSAALAAASVSGVPQVGATLEASFAETPGGTLTWQWLRGEEEIAGADAATYAPVAADVGSQLAVRVSRGEETAVSAPTAPVWPAPANPALAPGEEELLSTTLTLGASDEFPLRMGGYNRFVGGPFGEMDETSFDEGARSHVVEMVMLNELGRFVLATQGPLPPAAGLVVYWNAHRIDGLEAKQAVPGRDMLAGPSGIPRETYLPLADGTAEGVKVAVSVRRTHAVVSVTEASVTSGPGDNGTWDEDETIEAQVRFSAPVTVSGGPPTLAVMLDGNQREAAYSGGSGTDTLTFTWTVTEPDAGAKRARVASNGLALNGATLSAGSNTVVDTGFAVPPWVTTVAFAPDASGDREWTEGETIEAGLTFSEPVTVADGSPWIEIRIGGFSHPGTLGYASGSGSATLVFSTEVPAGANGFTGLAVVADSLEANGVSIVSAASGLAAELGHDGTEPTAAPGDAGAGEPLTAAFHDVPQSHDGTAFTLELRFGEPVPSGAAAPGAFIATGATVGAVSAQDDRTWSVTVTPDGAASAVTVTLPARDCTETGAVCTADGRGLESDVSASVAALPGETPFRVALEGLPEEHDGASDIVFRVVFNKRPAGFSYTVLRDQTLDIRQGGTRLTPAVRRVLSGEDRNTEWRVTVTPDGKEDVTVAIGPFSQCSDAGAICTESQEVVSNHIDETILGPPGLTVDDARVYEAPGATVDFVVRLGRASRSTVHVDYATSDGTGENAATAGEDYAEKSGTLAFAPGETEHTVSVLVYQDGHDEGEETFTLTLSNPRGGNAYLADATAVGTIENTDHMPKAWLARFGRTVAEQMVDAVDARFAAGRSAGVEMTLAGQPLAGASPEEIEALEEREAEKRLEAFAERLKGVTGEDDEAPEGERALTGRDFLTGTAFTLTAGTAEDGYGAVWGRGAASRFDGREGELSLEGEVTSVMLGADFTRDAGTLGLALTHSRGEGSYQGEGEGEVSSTLTGLYPYGRWEVSPRVSVWGVAGYGEGALTLTPEGQGPLETDMNLMMGAVGTRAVALEAPAEGGVELSVTSDAMAVRTRSEAETGEGGNLAEAQADVTRLRLGLEGTWRGIGADGGATLAPTLEVGVRHDGGDAETGFGLDVGGGLAWAHPRVGLSADVRARALLTHESDGFGERGLSGSLGFDPRPGSDRGFAMTLTQTMGAQASGGMDALLGHRHLEGLGAGDEGGLGARRLELKAGYGFAVFGDRFTATPQARLGLSESQRELGLGWRLGLARSGPVTMELGLEGTRSEPTGGDGEAVNALMLRGTVRW